MSEGNEPPGPGCAITAIGAFLFVAVFSLIELGRGNASGGEAAIAIGFFAAMAIGAMRSIYGNR